MTVARSVTAGWRSRAQSKDISYFLRRVTTLSDGQAHRRPRQKQGHDGRFHHPAGTLVVSLWDHDEPSSLHGWPHDPTLRHDDQHHRDYL